jgi:SAM-dependent methyltransferase
MTDKNTDIISLNKKAWNNISELYDKHRPDWLKESSLSFDFFCNHLPKKSIVLDLGSGTGLPFAKLMVERDYEVFGIDISPNMAKIAQHNVPQAKFIQLSMTDLNYHEKYDGIFSSFSMLLLDPLTFYDVAKRIVRSLKKGGIFYLSLNEPWEEGVDVDSEVIIEILGEKMYSRAYSEQEILDIFEPLGMELLNLHRKTQNSEIFGIEHTITLIFKKH